MKFSIIIINFFQKDYLESCLKSIYDNFKPELFETIIINNSPEQNIKYLSDKFNNLKITENRNKGFAEANNKGADIAEGEYLFFLNSDTLICNDFIEKLFDEIDFSQPCIVGLKLLNKNLTFQLSFGYEVTFLNEIKNKKKEKIKTSNSGYEDIDKVIKVDWVSGAAMIIKKDIFKLLKGFDESYFMYYEDSDICKRASAQNIPIYYFPNSKIIHFKGENIKPDFYKDTYYYAKESQLIYYKKHNSLFQRLILRIYLIIKFLPLSLFNKNKVNKKITRHLFGISK